VSNEDAVPAQTQSSKRKAVLEALAERVLEAPDLAGLARILTVELRSALKAERASLMLWDRRLESFEAISLDASGRLSRHRLRGSGPAGPRTRFLLSEGELVETSRDAASETLVPLLARSGLAGMLVLGPVPRKRVPVSDAEARLVSVIASRAALAFENLAYQKELIESERLAALGTMAGMLVHDFRGPMTLIRGWAETLVEGGVEPGEVATRAQAIVDAVDRLDRMTGETLDFARGAEKLVLRSVPLGVFVADLAAGLEQELPGLTLECSVQLPGGRRGPLDVDKIRRAVTNIAANARDAMGGSGRLALAARVEAIAGVDGPRDHLVLELSDDGPGVPRAIRERVFEPFVTHGKKRGTGLGLAVARRFVEDHGGSLELVVEAGRARRGARFRIALPLGSHEERPR
jgi:signal transduction histidine kinase